MIRNNIKGRNLIGKNYLPSVDRIIASECEMHEKLGKFLF